MSQRFLVISFSACSGSFIAYGLGGIFGYLIGVFVSIITAAYLSQTIGLPPELKTHADKIFDELAGEQNKNRLFTLGLSFLTLSFSCGYVVCMFTKSNELSSLYGIQTFFVTLVLSSLWLKRNW